MKKKIGLCAAAVLFVLLVLWGREACLWKKQTLFAMDTYCSIQIKGKDRTLQKMTTCIEECSRKFNAYAADSDVFALNNCGYTKDREIVELTKALLAYYERTGGAFDFTMKKISDAWGFQTEHPRVPETIHFSDFGADKAEIRGDSLSLKGVEADYGGVLKGYVTDKLVRLMREEKVREAVLDLGGNVFSLGTHKIGVKNPQEGDSLACAVTVTDKAVITSGVYQRYFTDENGKNWHHILNPATGFPAENDLLSVTVIGESGTACDVLSTAFLVMGKEKAFQAYKEFDGIEVILVTKDTIYYSPGLSECLEKQSGQYEWRKIQ